MLAPLLPLAAAIVLAVLIAAVSARFKHANVVVIVLTLAATLAAVFGSLAFSSQADDMAAMTALGTELRGPAGGRVPSGGVGDGRHRKGRSRGVCWRSPP